MQDVVWFLLIGLAAGWLAGQIVKGGGFGVVGDVVVGVIGAILGGFLFGKETKTRTKANLLIFVTPTLIQTDHFQAPTTDFLQGQNGPTAKDFLSTRLPQMQDKPDSFMDSAKPKDWRPQPIKPATP